MLFNNLLDFYDSTAYREWSDVHTCLFVSQTCKNDRTDPFTHIWPIYMNNT